MNDSDHYDPALDMERCFEEFWKINRDARLPIRVEAGDCLSVIPRLVAEGVVVDAVVTDPPYHLGPQRVQELGWPSWTENTRESRKAVKAGFMGQEWDGGDLAFRPGTWATIGTILRPGGFLLAFGGTRTHHRVWCAIEDAGFVIQDTIAWLFGSGFPKRRDMLKPAFEPIVLAYKPGGKRTLQVDECRIVTESPVPRGTVHSRGESVHAPARGLYNGERQFTVRDDPMLGRWPANVCHDGSDEVLAAFPESEGQRYPVRGDEKRKQGQVFTGFADPLAFAPRGDTGSAARFFYEAKADKHDRWGSRHPTVKPVELLKWLVPLVTPKGGLFLDPFAGSGTAAVAALATGRRAILIEREESYLADIRERVAFYMGEGRHSLAAKARRRTTESLIGGLFT